MLNRVLVVDDDRAIAQLAKVWLCAAGFQADVSYDGDDAMVRARAHRPDVILLDLRMPRVDGLTVQGRLRGDPSLGNVPVVFISANVQESARRQAIAGGARGFLNKPYDADDLIAAVRNAIASPSPGPQAAAGPRR